MRARRMRGFGWAWVALLGVPVPVSAAEGALLHEVVRHFEVAFVDRANLAALLLGGLQGLKSEVPQLSIEVGAGGNLFNLSAGGKTISLARTAIGTFPSLESALG